MNIDTYVVDGGGFFDAIFDQWSVTERKEHINSLNYKEINQFATHSKRK